MKEKAMHYIIKISCCKISGNLNLSVISSYFKTTYDPKHSDSMFLGEAAVSSILKIRSNFKSIYLYEYGCIVFVDFTSDEIYTAMGFFETIIGELNYKLSNNYNGKLIIDCIDYKTVSGINHMECLFEYSEDTLRIACDLTAKSTELSAAEEHIIQVLDASESIVNSLQKGKLSINSRKFVSKITQMARFQYNTIKSLRLFDTTFYLSLNNKGFYNFLYKYYEIADRTSILKSKIDEINRLISTYTTLSYNSQEMRLLLFECILLTLFLIPHLIGLKILFR